MAVSFWVLSVLLVSGCSGVPTAFAPPVAVDISKGRRSIGVISMLGATFSMQKVGVTVFSNEYKSAPIASWGIDDVVNTKIANLLAGDVDVKRISYPKDAFAAYEAPGGLFRDHSAEFKDGLRKVTAGQKCDLYLAVVAGGSAFGSSNQFVKGIGIVQGSSVFVNQMWIHALFQMRLYDGRTLELLGWKPATLGQSTFMAVIRGPNREVEASFWPQTERVETDGRLRTAVRELVEQGVAATLPEVLTLGRAVRAD